MIIRNQYGVSAFSHAVSNEQKEIMELISHANNKRQKNLKVMLSHMPEVSLGKIDYSICHFGRISKFI